jgi:hypothetical protein
MVASDLTEAAPVQIVFPSCTHFLHVIARLQIFVHPLFTEITAMCFGQPLRLENDALEVFDIDRGLSGIHKNIPPRAPPLWHVGMNSHSLALNEIAFVWGSYSLLKRQKDGKYAASPMPFWEREFSSTAIE